MEDRDMIRMANQIADYFKAYPETTAVNEIANHIRSFWEPRMRKHLFDHMSKGGAGLHVLVVKAAETLKAPA